jgi:hypothetical protein
MQNESNAKNSSRPQDDENEFGLEYLPTLVAPLIKKIGTEEMSSGRQPRPKRISSSTGRLGIVRRDDAGKLVFLDEETGESICFAAVAQQAETR